jgi:diguanylate cyclase (GGDEF)-like protein/PAS domain S-box-containing protein
LPVKRHYPHFLVLCVLGGLLYTGLLSPFQDVLTDLRFRTVPRPASGLVTVVAIDSPSLQEVGVWPWPRRLHADLIRKLSNAGVADIVFDVDFSVRAAPDDDAALAHALGEAGGAVVLPVFKQSARRSDGATAVHVNRPLPQFMVNAWPASVNVSAEPDGRVRRYAFGDTIDGKFVPSAAVMLASGSFALSKPPFFLDYSIRLADIPVVSFADVLSGRVDPAGLRGRRVIIGATAIELGDRYYVPNAGIVAGPKLHALAAESILQGRALTATSGYMTTGGLVALMLIMLVLWKRTGLSTRTISLVLAAVAIEAGAVLVQARWSIIIDTAAWHVAIVAYLVVTWLDEIDLRGMLARIARQRFQSIAMSLSDGVVCTDARGAVTFWNPAAASIFGLFSGEVLGRPFGDFCKTRNGADGGGALGAADPVEIAIWSLHSRGIELVGVRKGGETFAMEVSLSSWPGIDGCQYGIIVRDISVRKREEERTRYLATHDSLTGLLNRAGLRSALSEALDSERGKGDALALILIDLDNFKNVNDVLGHQAGDEVLRQVAGCLGAVATGSEKVGRLGGDEFAVLVRSAGATAKATDLAKSITDALKHRRISVEGQTIVTGASVGIAVGTTEGQTLDELLVNADLALYQAKGAKRGSCAVYTPKLRRAMEERRTLEKELALAVDREEFELFYQPQVRLRDSAVVGVEALLRWRHPVRGLLAPGHFLQALNGTTLSNEVGSWVLRNACRQGYRWHRAGHRVRVGVNLAPSQFQSDLSGAVERVLADSGLPPEFLELEVTENILLGLDDATGDLLRRIRAMGVGIAFDDFGTGYASLTHLKQFPLGRLKIDRSFVRDLATNDQSTAIVSAIAGLGRRLGLSIVAEGVEDASVVTALLDMGCDEAQGYLFGKPMPASDIEQRLVIANGCSADVIATAA